MIKSNVASDSNKTLSNEEIKKLFIELSNGSLEARNRLIEYNVGYVIYLVKEKFKNIEYDDLISCGFIGLIKAIDTFNINKKIQFLTYANTCIMNEILMYLRKQKRQTTNNGMHIDSLNKIVTIELYDDKFELQDIIESNYDLQEEYEEKETMETINNQIEELSNEDRKIIELYYGLNGNKEHTQKEIGQIIGSSQSYLSRKIKAVTNKVKKKINKIYE